MSFSSSKKDASQLSEQEVLRYSRHLQLPGVGASGQLKLKAAHALIIGCGGLGAPVSQYLAAAGVGQITLVDGDTVELSNLQRQVTFSEADIGLPKSEQTKIRLLAMNSDVRVTAVGEHFNVSNASALLDSVDVVLDCTDNFAARYLINDACKLKKLPWAYASIHQFSGQLAFFTPDQACFRCLFPNPPATVENCNAAGVLGVLPGILGTLQAAEALKYLLGLPVSSANKLMMVEIADMDMRSFTVDRSADCPSCQGITKLDEHSPFYQTGCAASAVGPEVAVMSTAEFDGMLSKPQSVQLVIDVRSPAEHSSYNLGGINVPLAELEQWLIDHSSREDLVFYCQIGTRSAKACEIATQRGLRAVSLAGGVNAYLDQKLNSAR